MSIASIVSTQVAPRLHNLHQKEGQFDALFNDQLLVFSSTFLDLLKNIIDKICYFFQVVITK
jgi:hypothetical protein